MNFKAILNRLTGLSCPIFGISWNPIESEIIIEIRKHTCRVSVIKMKDTKRVFLQITFKAIKTTINQRLTRV